MCRVSGWGVVVVVTGGLSVGRYIDTNRLSLKHTWRMAVACCLCFVMDGSSSGSSYSGGCSCSGGSMVVTVVKILTLFLQLLSPS